MRIVPMPQRTRTVLILAGLLPVAVSLVAIVFWPLAIPAVFAANAGVGRIVGERVSLRPFLVATMRPMGVAYWNAIEHGTDADSLDRRGPNPLWDVLAKALARKR